MSSSQAARRLMGATAAAAVLLAMAADASAESGKLQMKRVETSPRASVTTAGAADYMFRQTYPQHFYMQIRECAAVAVRKGQTAVLPFGPSYRPQVTASGRGGENVSLEMSLVGSAGERCTNLIVDGGRPPSPTFTITSSKGEEVASGLFKYG